MWALSVPNMSVQEAADKVVSRTVFQVAKPDADPDAVEAFVGIPTKISARAALVGFDFLLPLR